MSVYHLGSSGSRVLAMSVYHFLAFGGDRCRQMDLYLSTFCS
jgi:hypothetical protein